MKALLLPFAALLTTALPAQTVMTQYWVDGVNGKDTNAGTQAAPFKTLTKALQMKKADTVVHVLPATYGPRTTGDFWDATASKAAKIRLSGYTNFRLVGTDRDKCIIDFNGNAGIWYGYLEITGAATDGVEITGLTFKNLANTPWGNSPINLTGAVKKVDIHGCYFEDTNSTFINWGGFDCAFHDNVIVTPSTKNNANVAIRVRTQYFAQANGDRMHVYNNLVVNHHHGISYDGKNSKQWIVNNIVINGNIGFPGSAPTSTNVVIENNCSYGNNTNFNYAVSKTNLTVDPQLVDVAKANYRLKSTSPCIEAGYAGTLAHEVNDYYGNARVVDIDNDGLAVSDIGAHEANVVSLRLVQDWAQGKSPIFQFASTDPKVALGFFTIGWVPSGSKSFPIWKLSPFGTIGSDPASWLFRSLVALPTGSSWKPLPAPIPVTPSAVGFPVYVQGFGYSSVSVGDVWKPTGRLDLFL